MIPILTEKNTRNGERVILLRHSPAHIQGTERAALVPFGTQEERRQREGGKLTHPRLVGSDFQRLHLRIQSEQPLGSGHAYLLTNSIAFIAGEKGLCAQKWIAIVSWPINMINTNSWEGVGHARVVAASVTYIHVHTQQTLSSGNHLLH